MRRFKSFDVDAPEEHAPAKSRVRLLGGQERLGRRRDGGQRKTMDPDGEPREVVVESIGVKDETCGFQPCGYPRKHPRPHGWGVKKPERDETQYRRAAEARQPQLAPRKRPGHVRASSPRS